MSIWISSKTKFFNLKNHVIMEKITTGAEIMALSYTEAEALFENGAEIMEKLEGFQKFGETGNTPEMRKAYWDMKEDAVKANPKYVTGFNFAKEAKEEYAATYLDTLQHNTEEAAPAEVADPTPAPTPVTKENKTDEIVLENAVDSDNESNGAGEQFYLAEITDQLSNDLPNIMSNIELVLQLASHAEIPNLDDLPQALQTKLEEARERVNIKAKA